MNPICGNCDERLSHIPKLGGWVHQDGTQSRSWTDRKTIDRAEPVCSQCRNRGNLGAMERHPNDGRCVACRLGLNPIVEAVR